MGNMWVHQCTKAEPNWFRDGTIIGTNAHTHSPPTQTLFHPQFTISLHFIFVYLSIYIYLHRGKQKFISLQTYPYAQKCIKLSNKLSEMCSIPHENPATKHFLLGSPLFCTLKCSSVKSACSSVKSDLMSNICPFYNRSIPPIGFDWQH